MNESRHPMDSRKSIKLIIVNGILCRCYRKCRSKSQRVRCLMYMEFSLITLYCWKEGKEERMQNREIEKRKSLSYFPVNESEFILECFQHSPWRYSLFLQEGIKSRKLWYCVFTYQNSSLKLGQSSIKLN